MCQHRPEPSALTEHPRELKSACRRRRLFRSLFCRDPHPLSPEDRIGSFIQRTSPPHLWDAGNRPGDIAISPRLHQGCRQRGVGPQLAFLRESHSGLVQATHLFQRPLPPAWKVPPPTASTLLASV